MSLYQNDVQIEKEFKKTEKEFQNKMKKNENSDKKKVLIKKSSESMRETERLALSFNQMIL